MKHLKTFENFEHLNEGVDKNAIKRQIKVIEDQIDSEEGGDGEPLTSETLSELEKEKERLEKLIESVNESLITDESIVIREGQYNSSRSIVEGNDLDEDWAFSKIGGYDHDSWDDEINTLLEGTNYEAKFEYYKDRRGDDDAYNSFAIVTKKVPIKSDGNKMCMKDDKGNTVGR
jgi:hypothetical protein